MKTAKDFKDKSVAKDGVYHLLDKILNRLLRNVREDQTKAHFYISIEKLSELANVNENSLDWDSFKDGRYTFHQALYKPIKQRLEKLGFQVYIDGPFESKNGQSRQFMFTIYWE